MLEFENHDFPPLRYPGIIFGNLKHLEITYMSYMWPGLSKSYSQLGGLPEFFLLEMLIVGI